MELATEIVKLVTALLGLAAAVVALLPKAQGGSCQKKGRKR